MLGVAVCHLSSLKFSVLKGRLPLPPAHQILKFAARFAINEPRGSTADASTAILANKIEL